MQKEIKFWKQFGTQEMFFNLQQIEIILWKVCTNELYCIKKIN